MQPLGVDAAPDGNDRAMTRISDSFVIRGNVPPLPPDEPPDEPGLPGDPDPAPSGPGEPYPVPDPGTPYPVPDPR
jgi:hypothetical protein